MEFISHFFGKQISSSASSIDKEPLVISEHQFSNEDYQFHFINTTISKSADFFEILIENLEVVLNLKSEECCVDKIKSIFGSFPNCKVTIKSYSISTAEVPNKRHRSTAIKSRVQDGPANRGSFPAGHSYPPEDEWSLVFGCPFYNSFPSVKGLPIILLKGDARVSIGGKKVTTMFLALVPLYLVFYESEASAKPISAVFLSNAKIEVESNCSFSVSKSGNKYEITFSKIQTMQEWSQKILCIINNAASDLEKWRSNIVASH
ncbi:hypothetical protein GPJ56_005865 [Histomonas meleagridis]|uniref:uncharacterized protein n=1 Tax=Histomonas meleagridis TaxID=135588 RepID=UPI003559F39A|nr:hypothetical protein GPJ56_005865 [Histomonas meleagridis]KAH0798600.1 hypothetical protein GO595_008465 [Histomonas meleagridis]